MTEEKRRGKEKFSLFLLPFFFFSSRCLFELVQLFLYLFLRLDKPLDPWNKQKEGLVNSSAITQVFEDQTFFPTSSFYILYFSNQSSNYYFSFSFISLLSILRSIRPYGCASNVRSPFVCIHVVCFGWTDTCPVKQGCSTKEGLPSFVRYGY